MSGIYMKECKEEMENGVMLGMKTEVVWLMMRQYLGVFMKEQLWEVERGWGDLWELFDGEVDVGQLRRWGGSWLVGGSVEGVMMMYSSNRYRVKVYGQSMDY